MLTTQIILCGVAFEAEVEYTVSAWRWMIRALRP
jgi:hypothetical protein